MNGALPPKRYELLRNSFSMTLPLVERLDVPPRGALVELAWPADLVLGVGNHLLPLRDPADGAREREDAGEHRHRDAERALHDAGVEVHIRIQLSAYKVIILERDLLERHGELEDAVVVQPELVQHFMAGLAHQLRTRVVRLGDPVAEAPPAPSGSLGLR